MLSPHLRDPAAMPRLLLSVLVLFIVILKEDLLELKRILMKI